MSRATLVLVSPAIREKAAYWASKLPDGTRVTFSGPLRSISQNSRMWAMLTDVATQLLWHGVKLSPDEWKLLFLDSLKREIKAIINLDGTGFVNVGNSSSDLSKEEMGDLMMLITMFGDKHGVLWSDPKEVALRELEHQR